MSHAVIRDSELVVQHCFAVRHKGDVAAYGGVEVGQDGAPKEGAVVDAFFEIVGPEIEVAQVVVHNGGYVERADRDERLDAQRADRAVYMHDVGTGLAEHVLESAQRHLGVVSGMEIGFQPMDVDSPVFVWDEVIAHVGKDCIGRLLPRSGWQNGCYERDFRARQCLEVAEVVFFVSKPLAVGPDDVGYSHKNTL